MESVIDNNNADYATPPPSPFLPLGPFWIATCVSLYIPGQGHRSLHLQQSMIALPLLLCLASLFKGSIAASLAPLPEVRQHVSALTYSWHLPGFTLQWMPCCFPSSSSRGETTCPSPNLQLTICIASNLNGSLAASLAPLPEVRLLVPGLTYSWHLHGFPLSVYLSKGESVHLFCWRFSCFCHGWREGNGYQALIKPGTAKELKGVANDLKVPKCEIFSSLRFSLFLYHKASMDRWLCAWNKKYKILLFGENLIFAHAECAPKKLLCLLLAWTKIWIVNDYFWTHLYVSQKIF